MIIDFLGRLIFWGASLGVAFGAGVIATLAVQKWGLSPGGLWSLFRKD